MINTNEAIDLSKVEKILGEYKGMRGVVIPVLQRIQNEYGYLPEPVIDLMAERLNISVHEIVGTATFYSQFHLKPRGQHIVKVCCGTACHVKGAKKILDKLSDLLEVSVGATTKDKLFTLEEVACLGACSLAPVVVIDDDIHGKMEPDATVSVIKKMKGQDTHQQSEQT